MEHSAFVTRELSLNHFSSDSTSCESESAKQTSDSQYLSWKRLVGRSEERLLPWFWDALRVIRRVATPVQCKWPGVIQMSSEVLIYNVVLQLTSWKLQQIKTWNYKKFIIIHYHLFQKIPLFKSLKLEPIVKQYKACEHNRHMLNKIKCPNMYHQC